MKKERLRWVFLIAFSIPLAASAQKMVSGLVVDSLTLGHLPHVTVKVIGENRGTTSDINGMFKIRVTPGDTLGFTSVGYKRSLVVVLAQSEEEILFVRMREESFLLNEVIIRDRSLKFLPEKISSPTLSGTKPLKAGDVSGLAGVGVNFSYFTKQEREKRKLVAILKELQRIQAYKAIIYDADFKYGVMQKYSLSEARYYELLALFNQGYQNIIRSGNEYDILYNLNYYFDHAHNQK